MTSYVPRQCGIATFSHDLCEALCERSGNPRTCEVIAVNDTPEGYAYPDRVRFQIRQEDAGDYRLAAAFVNVRNLDLLLVQHEFGIYGGEAGSRLIGMLRDVSIPVVTTMHTVLREPDAAHRRATQQIIALSDRIVVMAHRAIEILQEVYDVPSKKVVLIPHGVPDVPFVDPASCKGRFGVEDRKVLLTFGLLSPGKGIEHAIRALPDVVRRHPDVLYVVLGATHPHVKKSRGEEYRHGLQRLAEELGVLEHVCFQNRYVDAEELMEFLGAADVYLTPYLAEAQIVSGTLTYAAAAGKAIVSTPYWYARELLADGRGALVPFADPAAVAREVNRLLDDEGAREAMRKRAYQFTRPFVWREVARSYIELFHEVVRDRPMVSRKSPRTGPPAVLHAAVPEFKLDHLKTLTDDVGILQHARYSIPNRSDGYCTDDNARALIFALRARRHLHSPELRRLAITYLGFLQHAYNPATGRFRNFLSYDRRWLEAVGSEDSHGRALWALGHAVTEAPTAGMRAAAADLFLRAIEAVERFQSPRAWAFTLVGIHAYAQRGEDGRDVRWIHERLAERLFAAFERHMSDDWIWPESLLTYANGKLPHALLLAGRSLRRPEMVRLGLRALAWLLEVQTTDDGVVAPIGNRGWWERGGERAHYDQQPLELHALLEACIAAYQITSEPHWLEAARRCFDWFLGANSQRRILYDYETGGCRDGLEPAGVNDNQGAESTLAWLLSLLAIRSLEPEEADTLVSSRGVAKMGFTEPDAAGVRTA